MKIDLSEKEFRRLLDMAYIGNWILNSTRENDRFQDYDDVESKLFSYCRDVGMDELCTPYPGFTMPSDAFVNGGIHDAIAEYENSVFFDILAEELTFRDMNYPQIDATNVDEFNERVDEYLNEFEANGLDNINVDGDMV